MDVKGVLSYFEDAKVELEHVQLLRFAVNVLSSLLTLMALA